MIVVPTDTPGVEIRPIRDLATGLRALELRGKGLEVRSRAAEQGHGGA